MIILGTRYQTAICQDMSESFLFFGKHEQEKMLKLLTICLNLLIITSGAPTAKKTGKIFSSKF